MGTANELLGRGWRFPPALDPDRGRIALADGPADVEQALRIILLTDKGERAMRPEFGVGLPSFVHAPLDSATIAQVESAVREALQRWEPRIDVQRVEARATDPLDGKLEVEVVYTLRSVNRRDNQVEPLRTRVSIALGKES
jgi:uncharacterized protein